MTTMDSKQGDLTVIPALYEHACNVYNAMLESAVPDPEYNDEMVYEGHFTNLFKKLRLSVPYYTEIKNKLIAMGCIEQVRRGGGTASSKWVLWKPPELDDWKSVTPVRARKGNKVAMLEKQIKDLTTRVDDLESQMTKALLSFSQQQGEMKARAA